MIADFARAMGKFAKTDKIDATILAEFGSRIGSKLTTPASEELRALEAVTNRRAQILEMITMESNRLGSTRDESARASLEAVIVFLREQVSDMDSQMLEIVRGNTELKALDELLQSVPGVGFVVSSTLLSSLPELGSASRGAISSLVGVAPLNHDSDHARSDPSPLGASLGSRRCILWSRSGSHRGVRYIRAGRGNVRSVLYMSILSAIRHNPVLRVVYERLVTAGKAIPPEGAFWDQESEDGGCGGVYEEVGGDLECDCA